MAQQLGTLYCSAGLEDNRALFGTKKRNVASAVSDTCSLHILLSRWTQWSEDPLGAHSVFIMWVSGPSLCEDYSLI
ncbi:unnamed protein product [Nezara viridula]|uniref:Uncharacterized protein n=1 Tax=Nezara viridula TaxID=85310 RepID=A0A9P0HSS3_NEZVI|nr:unnamed protein product [Nezara viridula]